MPHRNRIFWPKKTRILNPAIPSAPRKAGYAVRSLLRKQQTGLDTGSYPRPWQAMLSRCHAPGPPRKEGQRPHAIVDRPPTLTPTTDPRLGVVSLHQGLHRCALWRIFSPAFRKGRLTRILHHSSGTLNYSINTGFQQ